VVQKVSNGGGAPGAWWTRGLFSEHVACVGGAEVGADLGFVPAEFGLGLKTKVVAHELLYNFR
jgi:hypothetical protein